jgi:predicted TIM-barrel fold metal-dependent hydrolase
MATARKFPIIDAHTHPFGDRGLDLSPYIRTVRDPILLRRRQPALFQEMLKGTDDLTEEMLAAMDAAGIDKAVVQSRGIGTNEAVAAAVRRHPDRLVGLFRPVYNTRISGPQEAIDYAELARSMAYWVNDLGLRGMGEIRVSRFSSASAPDRIAQDLEPLLEVLAEHRMPIMFQTAWTQFGTPIYHGVPAFVDDLAERFPEVPFIITKMGRGYDALFEMCLLIAFKHDNVYLDTVQSRPEHVRRAVAEIGADRILFGSDWEQTWAALKTPADLYTRSLAIVDDAGLSEAEQEWVLGKTAATLFRI